VGEQQKKNRAILEKGSPCFCFPYRLNVNGFVAEKKMLLMK
jgi:hypothetical protein